MQAHLRKAAHQQKKIQQAGIYLALILLVFPSFAFAYVDPGSISILLQVVLAFFLGGVLTFKKKIIRTIKALFQVITFKK